MTMIVVFVLVHFLVFCFLTLDSEAYVPPAGSHTVRRCSLFPIRLAAPLRDVNGDKSATATLIEAESPSISDSSNIIIGSLETTADKHSHSYKNYDSIFEAIANRAATCLYQSDLRRDAVGKAAGKQGSSATNWIDDASAFALQQTLSRLRLETSGTSYTNKKDDWKRDETLAWHRWMRSVPVTTVIDLSSELWRVVDGTLKDENLQQVDQKRHEFLNRIGARLIILPSGSCLASPLLEPSASIIYGKLVWGGVTRYRLLGSHVSTSASNNNNNSNKQRQAGRRTELQPTLNDNVPAWMQYGGPDRMYEAVDMGTAALLEILLLPRGKSLLDTRTTTGTESNMMIQNMPWKPQDMFGFWEAPSTKTGSDDFNTTYSINDNNKLLPAALRTSGRERNEAFRSDFTTVVGGLQPQIDAIVRRVLDGRVIRPVDPEDNVKRNRSSDAFVTPETEPRSNTNRISEEAQELALLGLTPIRGLLLYGPPGCGKTLIARQLAAALRARTPKIVAAPELLDRWVGGSEKLVRLLFADAEAELRACGGDATKSALHVVVIDEIDAVFRKRSSAEDSGEATRSSVVNQILAKLDGVSSIPNLLLIGMTNRRELLDEALLRPGRLEVQVEIPLPDAMGRREILDIHFHALRQRGRLSHPLCCAIDGVSPVRMQQEESIAGALVGKGVDSSSNVAHAGGKRRAVRQVMRRIRLAMTPFYDLSSDAVTGGFSGADIAGLVRCAGSLALARCRRDGSGVESLLITLEDVQQALAEVK